MLPFTAEQFFAVFADYNAAIWPMQLLAYVLGLAAVALVFVRSAASGRRIAIILASMWAWTGAAYHLSYFAVINGAAYGFGALFLVEAAALTMYACRTPAPQFSLRRDARTVAGVLFVFYAGILYPLVGLATGQAPGELPVFGVTPCPVTIFTFGLLLLATSRPPWWVWLIPVAWSFVASSAAFSLGVAQDWPLLITGPASLSLWYLGRGARPIRRPGEEDGRRAPA